MYCFSPGFECFIVVLRYCINGTPRDLGGYFLGLSPMSKRVSVGCSGLGNNDTHLYIISSELDVISCTYCKQVSACWIDISVELEISSCKNNILFLTAY